MEEGQARNDEEASLTKGHGEPKPDSRGRVIDHGVPRGPTEIFVHSLPCEYDEGEQVATGEPEVAFICWRNRPIVRKTKFGLWDGRLSAGLWATVREELRTYRANSTAERVRGENGDENAKNDER